MRNPLASERFERDSDVTSVKPDFVKNHEFTGCKVVLGMRSRCVRVVAAVIARGDRFLVCKRPVHKRHGGLWEFPGGKYEPGESDFDAVQRELWEELGVRSSSNEKPLFEIQDDASQFLIAFLSAQIEGEPQCLEHSELGWFTVTQLAQLSLAPSDRKFVEFILNTP